MSRPIVRLALFLSAAALVACAEGPLEPVAPTAPSLDGHGPCADSATRWQDTTCHKIQPWY